MANIPQCINYQYFYITWDKSFPYGCKAMGFKSYKKPSLVVQESSGNYCLAFISKQTYVFY